MNTLRTFLPLPRPESCPVMFDRWPMVVTQAPLSTELERLNTNKTDEVIGAKEKYMAFLILDSCIPLGGQMMRCGESYGRVGMAYPM